MSAPIEPQGSALDELLSDEPLSAPARPSVLDSLRSSVGTDPTRYNQAVQEVPVNASPRFAAENPEWYEDRDLKKQARLIEERPRLRQSLERDPETVARIGAGRVEQIAKAHDTLQSQESPFGQISQAIESAAGQISQTVEATADQFQGTAMQYRVAFRANKEIADIITGSELGGALNRKFIQDDLETIHGLQSSMEGLSLAGKAVAFGTPQTLHMLAGLGSRAAAGGALSLTPAGPAGTAAGLYAGGAIPMVLLEQGLFYAESMQQMPEVPKEDRAAMSMMVGIVNGALELVPLEAFTGSVMNKFNRDAMRLLADRRFRDKTAYVLRRIGAQILSEAPTEAMQEVPGTLVPLLRQYAKGEIDFEGIIDGIEKSELGRRMKESAVMGAIGAPVPAAIGIGLSSIGRRGQVQQAQENRDTFQKIADAAVDNREIIDEMPERYHQLIEEAVDEDGQIEGIYINPDALTDAYEGDGAVELAQLLNRVPGLAKAIQTAQETGGKVRLSPADFATYVAPSERFQKLADDLSFNEDQGSLRESFEATKPENIEKIKAQLNLLREAAGVDPERDVALEKDFVQNLSAIFDETIPAVSAPVREKNAQLLGRIVMQISEMDGSDPLEAMSDLLDRVQFEQRRELDSPGEVQRSGQVLREGGDPQVIGQDEGPPVAGEPMTIFDPAGNAQQVDVVEVSDEGSVLVRMPDGSEVVLDLAEQRSQNPTSPSYRVDGSGDAAIEGKPVSELTDEELASLTERAERRIAANVEAGSQSAALFDSLSDRNAALLERRRRDDPQVLGQAASISMPVFQDVPPAGSVLRDGSEALDLWMMGMGLSDGTEVDSRLIDAWTQLNLVEPDGEGGYNVTEGAWDQELSNWADAAESYPSAQEFEAFEAATVDPETLRQSASFEPRTETPQEGFSVIPVGRVETEFGDLVDAVGVDGLTAETLTGVTGSPSPRGVKAGNDARKFLADLPKERKKLNAKLKAAKSDAEKKRIQKKLDDLKVKAKKKKVDLAREKDLSRLDSRVKPRSFAELSEFIEIAMDEAGDQSDWYKQFGEGIRGLVGRANLQEASIVFGITSAQNSTRQNLKDTLRIMIIARQNNPLSDPAAFKRAIMQRPKGKGISISSNEIDNIIRMYQSGTYKGGLKVSNYMNLIRDRADNVFSPYTVQDVHMARVMGFLFRKEKTSDKTGITTVVDGAQMPSANGIRYSMFMTELLANKFGIKPDAVQALLWFYAKNHLSPKLPNERELTNLEKLYVERQRELNPTPAKDVEGSIEEAMAFSSEEIAELAGLEKSGAFDTQKPLSQALSDGDRPHFRSDVKSDPYSNIDLDPDLLDLAQARAPRSTVSANPGRARGYGLPQDTPLSVLQDHERRTLEAITDEDGQVTILRAMGIVHEVGSTLGTWDRMEPSMVFTLPGETIETADFVSRLLGDALLQDAAITSQPSWEGQEFAVSFSKKDGSSLTEQEVSDIYDAVNPEHSTKGLNFTVSPDGTSLDFRDGRYFESGSYSEEHLDEFLAKISGVLGDSFAATPFNEKGNEHGAKDFAGESRRDSGEVWDGHGLAGRPDLQETAQRSLYEPAWQVYRDTVAQLGIQPERTEGPLGQPLQRSGSPGERSQEHEANHRRLGLLDDSGNTVSLDDLHQGTKTSPSVQRAVYRAMGLSAVDGQDTNAGLKIYPLQDVFSGDPAEVDAQLQTWLNSIGWTYKVFGPGQGEGGKPLYPDFQDPNTLSYEDKVAWIFDPTNEEGSFRDHAYTLAWRVTHEIAHGLVEAKLTEKYGEGRRAGAMGVVIRGPHYKQDSPRSLSDAMRAVEWEHEAFIEQRRILSEQFGIEISDEQFLLENSINMSDAVYRAITGQFGSPGDLGVTPKAIGNGEVLDNAFDILETLSQEIESAPAERDAPTVLKQDAADATNAAVDAFNRGDIGIFRQPAYHGSGSRFDKFSTDFMGTGEGAQAFGWGLYFSSSRGIAEFYRSALTNEAEPKKVVSVDGVVIRNSGSWFTDAEGPGLLGRTILLNSIRGLGANPYSEEHLDEFLAKISGDRAIDLSLIMESLDRNEQRRMRVPGNQEAEAAASLKLAFSAARDMAKTLESANISITEEHPGQVFEVDIPEDNELMDWDASLSEQTPSVRAAIKSMPEAIGGLNDGLSQMTTEEISEMLYGIDPDGEFGQVDLDGEPITEEEWRDNLLESALSMDADGELTDYMFGDMDADGDQFGAGFYAQLAGRLGSDRAASEALAAVGIKGHKYQANQISGGPGTATNFVIYDDAAISIAETFYSQSQEAKPSTRGQLIVDRRIQKFLLQLSEEKVNDSTLTHEIFHLALELVLDASERPGAGPEINEFREQILNFLNVDSREQIGRDQHERWAESGEVYMASGQAPTAELRNLFRFFFQRFKQVYRAIRDQLRNADPNNDFVPIFDRLLASEDQIRREANRDNVVAPMLAPELTELMTGPEEEELRRNLEAVNASERAKLESTIAKEDERILKAQMGELKTQVREEIYGRREHKLALWLRTGRTVTGDPIDDAIGLRVEGEHKMNGELLDEVSGDVSTRKSLRGMWRREGGLSPDAVAIAGGYNSTDEMLVELLAMEPSEDLIARIIHERAEVQGIVSTPEQLREAAAKKVDGQARDRLYAAQRRIARRLKGQMPAVDRVERKRLQGQAAPTVAEAKERVSAAQALLDESISQGADPGRIEGIQADIVSAEAGVVAAREARADQAQARRESRASRSKMPVQAIRAAARELVNELEFGQLKREMGRFKKMRAKASIAQTEAAVARDWDALEQAIDQEQLSNSLAEEAAKRLEDVNKYKRLIESFDKPKSRKRARLSKHGDYEDEDGAVTNVMDVIDGLLSMVSFKNISLRKIERAPNVALFAKLVEDSNGIVLPLPNWVSDVLDRPNYKKMKVSDLEDLYVGIKALEKFGMDMVLEREGIEKVAEQEEVDALLGTLEQQKPVLWAGKNKFGESQRSKSAKFFGGIIGAQMSFESTSDLLDDLNPEGNFNRFFMHRFKAAARKEERLIKLVSQKVNAAWDKYSPVEKREFYSKPIKIHSLGESLVKNEIMAIAANMGNPHNRAALMDAKAYGLTEVQIEEILSHVTERDADYLQSVLDAVDLLWEAAAAAEKEMNGVVPPKVQGVPWTLPSGRVMKGGYWPLMFDPALAERSAEHQAREIGKGLMPAGGGAAMTKVGSLKARKRSSGGLTIRTDFHAVLQKHVNSMSKDIAWRNTIVKADRQLRKLAPELKRVLGEPFYRQMRNYLKRQGTTLREGDQGPPDFVIKTARQARKGLGLTVMAWRLTQAAIQWSGFVTAIPRVGAANIAWGWADVTSTVWNWDRITHYRELIPELKNRAETFDRDAQQETLRLKPIDIRRPFSSLDTIQAFSANVGYTLLGMIDTVTSTAVAAGAMHQAMSGQVEGIAANDVEASVRYAGKIIDRTQGSGGAVNIPSMLDGGEMMKLLTPMMSFVNAQTQQAIVYGALGMRQIGDPNAPRSMIPGVPKEVARTVSYWFWVIVVEAILSEGTRYMINGLLGPDEPDEDAFFNTVIVRSIMGPLGGVPLLGEVESISRGFKPDTPLSSLLVTAYNATVKPAVDIAEGDYDGERHIRALATGITYATGIPSKQALDAIEVLTQESFGRGR